MPDAPTPGQVAYEALCTAYRAAYPGRPMAPWSDLVDPVHAAWEAAAQAVRAAQQKEETPCSASD